MFLGFRKPLYNCTEGMCHTSRYVTERDSVLPGLPHISITSNKHWGEKVWVGGYAIYRFHCILFTIQFIIGD